MQGDHSEFLETSTDLISVQRYGPIKEDVIKLNKFKSDKFYSYHSDKKKSICADTVLEGDRQREALVEKPTS